MDVLEGCILFRGVICCSGRSYAVQEGCMDAQDGRVMFRGANNVQEGYIDVQEGCILLRGLYAAQVGSMLFRRVIWMFRRLFVEENNDVFSGH